MKAVGEALGSALKVCLNGWQRKMGKRKW